LVIDRLREEIVRLKARLRYQERTAKEGPFGSSTPSAKVPLKANTPPESSARRGGAKPGHRGHGRRDIPDDEITRQETVPGPKQCPYCGGPLDPKGRKVILGQPERRGRRGLRGHKAIPGWYGKESGFPQRPMRWEMWFTILPSGQLMRISAPVILLSHRL
jgi:hypothetical protein